MRRWAGWIGFIIAALILVVIALVVSSRQALSHDWYADTGCCYGEGDKKDCDPAPPFSIREVDGGYVVTLTKPEMLQIRPSLRTDKPFNDLQWGITEFVPAKAVKSAQTAGFHVCLKATATSISRDAPLTWILCFFAPGNS